MTVREYTISNVPADAEGEKQGVPACEQTEKQQGKKASWVGFDDAQKQKQRQSVLLHSCCGPCSTAVIERLAPDYEVTVFFYNPNITDEAEYRKRKQTQIDFIQQYNENPEQPYRIGFIEGSYEPEAFFEKVIGLENEPESGKRCNVCYHMRLQKTAETASAQGYDLFTTTLSVSPHKDYSLISRLGKTLSAMYGVGFLDKDFKKKAGFQRSVEMSKQYHLYRQDYCGCVFANYHLKEGEQKMAKTFIPKGYSPIIEGMESQRAIKKIKDFFQQELAYGLNLRRVSAPLFVDPNTGLNDDLNGVERRVDFTVKDMGEKKVEIVQSLAKWKRYALGKYGIKPGRGIYTDMNAIRRDEEMDNLHSIYVDQWDWEKVIHEDDRTDDYLEETVTKLYIALKNLGDFVNRHYPEIKTELPNEIFFITTQELEDMYPDKTPKERENAIVEEKRAVFIKKIGGRLKSGEKHDGRAPDYDDWELNGDIVLWDEVLGCAFEISSMGIRVDEHSMLKQLEAENAMERTERDYHKAILNKELPYTIGGGIGQSRLCMFFLRKAHIGEVQASIWPQEMVDECEANDIHLL